MRTADQRKQPRWLTPAQITKLRKERAKGTKLRVLADRYGISISTVSKIANGHSRVAA